MKNNKYEIDMCNGTLMDKLISFAIPLMLSGMLQLMFNAVDIIVVGRFTGSTALAAVGSTTALISTFTNLFIGLSTIYMRIYFCGMPFFMLYNYGAAILRAVGDTKRPLIFLIISGCINALLNLFFVIVCKLDVAGVAIGTIVSQFVSSVLVLYCLSKADTSYKLCFNKLAIDKEYMLQIFQVGIPAGIQSTVINISNAMLQSSVNSFGSIAMAGYTAANNILGFLYVSVNSITQACMSFTSQNYAVGKQTIL